MENSSSNKTVCVTGAGGYIASWLVKLLLSHGYSVVGTVRDPENGKYVHLKKLDQQNLKLVKADLLDYPSLCAAVHGCDGVFHVASPVPSSSVANPEVELVEPAVKGTLNVLKACCGANVKRVVVVSSAAAVVMNPSWPQDQAKDEKCWSDRDYCRTTGVRKDRYSFQLLFCFVNTDTDTDIDTDIRLCKNKLKQQAIDVLFQNWYFYSKTVAESEALEYAKESGLNIATVCPSFVLGPMLQQAANASSLFLLKLMKGGYEEIANRARAIVDVRDVAEALVLVYEETEAEGRYICTSHLSSTGDLVEILKKHYPNYKYPERIVEVNDKENLSSEKLQRLGWRYRPLEETLVESVQSHKQCGLL